MFTSSDCKEPFSLETPTIVDESGDDDVTWAVVAGAGALRGNIRYEREDERVRAGRNEGRESIVVTTRKGPTVLPKHRITWRGEVYQVKGFAKYIDENRHWIQFTAVRTDAD